MLALPPPPPWGPSVGGKRRRWYRPPPRSNRNNDPVPPPPTAAEAGSITTELARAQAGAPPSSPTKVHIVGLHPNNKIATAMMEEEGSGLSALMVTANDNRGCGGRCPSRRHLRLKVVLPSPTLLTSYGNGGQRGAQRPVVRCTNAGQRYNLIIFKQT